MTAAAVVFWVAAVVMFGYGPAFRLALWITDRRRNHARATQVSDEWTSLQAAVQQARADIAAAELVEGTPLYDRLVCEQMERAEGWAS